ncbi:MAG: hypothetical protein EOM74_05090, partial [Methanomicrobia archaeon]|nr:hypothetical protein [Methanomicrobia archaeon]
MRIIVVEGTILKARSLADALKRHGHEVLVVQERGSDEDIKERLCSCLMGDRGAKGDVFIAMTENDSLNVQMCCWAREWGFLDVVPVTRHGSREWMQEQRSLTVRPSLEATIDLLTVMIRR